MKMVASSVMKLIGHGMDFLGLGNFLFSNKSSSSCCSSSSRMESSQREDSEPGLKALTVPAPHLNPCCISRANILPSSSMVPSSSSSSYTLCKPYKKKKTRKDFPPPIHVLTRTENSPCHMPWVLKRCYIDGRLVLREVPVKHHDYLKAQRSDGRLVLRMMYVDDNQLHPKKNVSEDHVGRDDGPYTSTTTLLEREEEERLEEKNAKSDNGDEKVDEDAGPSTSLTTSLMEEDGLEENKTSGDIDKDAIPSTSSRPSNAEDTKSDAEEGNDLDVKQEEEVETPAVDHHKAIKKVLNESRIYSSSMPEGRIACLPKDDTKSDAEDTKSKPSTLSRPSNAEDTKSDDEENDLDVKQEEEVETRAVNHHNAIKKVLNGSRIYSSSMPEGGRVACLPKDFLRIGTPTIGAIYS